MVELLLLWAIVIVVGFGYAIGYRTPKEPRHPIAAGVILFMSYVLVRWLASGPPPVAIVGISLLVAFGWSLGRLTPLKRREISA